MAAHQSSENSPGTAGKGVRQHSAGMGGAGASSVSAIGSRPVAGRALALAALLVATALLVLSWPRTQAAIHYLPVDTAIKRYFKTAELPSSQLAALREQAQESIDLYPHYRYYDGLSLINYLEALDPATPTWRRQPALYRSMSAGLMAVARAPATPRTWLRIARTRAALGQDEAAIADALRMSILTGRVEPTLLLARLELGYAYLDELDDDTRNLLRDQTLLTWRVNQRAFQRALNAGRLDVSDIESVIGSHNQQILEEMAQSLPNRTT